MPHLVLHFCDPLGTSTFICYHIQSLLSFCGFTVKHLVMGLEMLSVSRVMHLQDDQRLGESTTTTDRDFGGIFTSACVALSSDGKS